MISSSLPLILHNLEKIVNCIRTYLLKKDLSFNSILKLLTCLILDVGYDVFWMTSND